MNKEEIDKLIESHHSLIKLTKEKLSYIYTESFMNSNYEYVEFDENNVILHWWREGCGSETDEIPLIYLHSNEEEIKRLEEIKEQKELELEKLKQIEYTELKKQQELSELKRLRDKYKNN